MDCDRCVEGQGGERITTVTFGQEVCEHVAEDMRARLGRKPFREELEDYLANVNAVVVTREAQSRGAGPSSVRRDVTQADIDRWLFVRDAVLVPSDTLEDLADALDHADKVQSVQAYIRKLAYVRRGPREHLR